MVHRIKANDTEWKKKIYKDGGIRFTQRNKFIDVHKSMGDYWVDYGLKDGHVLATLKPAKNMKEAMKRVKDAKKEFILTEKR